ncbi:MAG TPA: dihydrolipoamide acetyltransferase family protein [Armatimonadota bacterium]|jgi:pyruvate dehydrogenase E2 component (dihydrolipoamide acetyltransferase)
MAIITMPKMGDTMNEGTIVTWIKKEGDMVKEGDVIAEIETEKAAIEIEAFESGILTKVIVHEGETVPVGAPIAQIGDDAGQPAEAVAPQAAAEASAPIAPAPMQAPPLILPPAPNKARVIASPLAKRIAKENDIDLRLIRGTGPGDRIVAEDVEAWIKSRAGKAAPKSAQAPAQAPVPAGDVWTSGKPASKMRQVIARRLTESKQQVPHFYATMDINMGPAMELRTQLNTRGDEFVKLSPNDLVLKAVADALRSESTMRVSFGGESVLTTERVNLGVAVALPDGLIVPVIRDADALSLNAIATQVRSLAERARAGKLLPDDYAGGTFTVTNLGMFGVEDFSAIINPPEPGILAVSAVADVPVVENGEIAVGTRMKVTLSADHRVVDGAVGARFLQEVKRRLESPLLLLQ